MLDLPMFPLEIGRQGEPPGEEARGRRDGIVSRRRNDQPAALFDQLDLAPGLEPQLATKLPGNENLPIR
ncbi:MAG: hypothetical protein L0H94_04865 [Nitrospira sp.]|nr:hypothetical protein [Nitrospira sp.]